MVTRPKKAAPAVPKLDFDALLDAAALPERTVPICTRGDLQAEHEQLNDELELLEAKAVDSLAGNGGAELAARIEALEVEMRAATYPFRLRALPGPKFRAFKAKHPVRVTDDKPDPGDQTWGFNLESGAEPLVRVSVIDPDLDDARWARLMDALTERQFDDLFAAAVLLNRGDIDIPFSRAASRLNRSIGAELRPLTG